MFRAFANSCFVLAFFSDLAYWKTVSYLWETISVWLLAVGLLGAALSIVAGAVAVMRGRFARRGGHVWLRPFGQLIVFALSLVNVFVHSRDGYTAVVPQGLILSTLVVIILFGLALSDRSAFRRQRVDQGLA